MNTVAWSRTGRLIAVITLSLTAAGLLSARADDPEKPWDRSAALGLTITRGNSDSDQLNATLMGDKVWTNDELRLQLDGNYIKTSDKESAEQLHALAKWNHLFTQRLYATLLADGLHDGIAGLAYQVILSPSAGYYFIKNDWTKLDGEVGPGFVFQKYDGRTEEDYVTLRLAERLEQKLSATAKLWQSLEYLPKIDNFSNYLLTAEVGVEAAITKTFSVRFVATDRYNSEPPAPRLKNDLTLVSAIAYKF